MEIQFTFVCSFNRLLPPTMPPTPPRLPGSAPERFHGLDSLRALAMLLGVYLHGAISFMTIDIPMWAAQDARRHWVFDVSIGAIHGFRMQLFFMLAGFFGHMLLARHGRKGFVEHRAKRIGLPFLLALVTISPLVGFAWAVGKGWLGSFFAGGFLFSMLAPAHLWFLYYLLFLCGAAAGIGAWLERHGDEESPARLDAAFLAVAGKWWSPVVLSVPCVILLLFSNAPGDIEAAPGMSLLPRPRALLYYGVFFAFGWFAHRNLQLLDSFKRRTVHHVVLAAICLPVSFAALIAHGSLRGSDRFSMKLVCAVAASLFAWFAVLGLTGFFLRFCNVSRPWIRYLSDSAYWVYLAHLPVVALFQVALAQWPMNVFVKFTLLMAGSLAVLYGSYHLLVRYTAVGRLLNGPRERPAPAVAG
jgi:peptidoglycan/LPS O-acetylase OafA/YrhL